MANYNYNHYNLTFSHIMIIVIISDEDMLNCNVYMYFLTLQNFLIFGEKMLISADLKRCVT